MGSGPWDTSRQHEFRTRFDEDVDAYDRSRPVAPAAVFDDLVRLSRLRRGSSVVEIGPGTGQATRRLAARGLRVLALEISPGLAARTREHCVGAPQVEVRTTSFEAWDPAGETFDAVVACNSFHWLDPDVRFVKTAAVLDRSGHLVIIATPVVVPDGASRFWWDIQDDWAAIGAGRVDPATKHPDLADDLVAAVRASGHFDEPAVARHPFDVSVTADEYVTNLSTQTGVKELPPDAQAALLRLVRRRVDALGGSVVVHHLAVLTVARRT